MQDLKQVYDSILVKKAKKRELQQMIKDELNNNAEYQKILEDAKVLKERKKSIETQIRAEAFSEANQIDDLTVEIKDDATMLSDIALSMYTAHQNIEIVDDFNNRLTPSFSVRYKKEGEVSEVEANKAKAKQLATAGA